MSNTPSAAPDAPRTAPDRGTPNTHLLFLDGMRGVAALYVVLFHAYSMVGWPRTREVLADHGWATGWLRNGNLAVVGFIVLSGYCLMLPVARTPGLELRGGVLGFVARRSRRILPPYFAALILCLALIAFAPGMGRPIGNVWDICLADSWTAPVLSHVFLVHNLSLEWSSKIDYPMWSVATEWQIYFVFALVLLPVWRRAGIVVCLFTAGALGAVPHFISAELDAGRFHYLLLFAFGMAAAKLPVSNKDGPTIFARLPWGWLALGLAVLCQFHMSYPVGPLKTHGWLSSVVTDSLAGLACAALIVGAAQRTVGAGGGLAIVVRLLSCRPAVALGAFSYSLYLMHAPILSATYLFVPASWTPVTILLFLLAVGGAASLLFSYLFHLAFERPFLTGNPRRPASGAHAAAVLPAP